MKINSKIPGFLLIVALITLLAGCGSRQGQLKHGPREVHIFAVNDMHAAIDNFPRLAFVTDSLRVLYPNMLLLSGGDNQTGNPVNDQHIPHGRPMIDLMNMVGFTLSAVGNHEFDNGIEEMRHNIDAASFDFLLSNAIHKDRSYPILPYKIITLPNGLKVAFVSLLYINSTGFPDCHPDKTKGFTFLDPLVSARKYLPLKEEVDLFVFLNHYGFEEDVKLAKSLPQGKADLIVGGHSHTLIEKDEIHNGVLITQAGSKLQYGTLITLRVYPNGRIERTQKLIRIGNTGSKQQKMKAMVEEMKAKSGLDKMVAKLEVDYTSKEPLGYLMADAQRAISGADIALINMGGVRLSELAKGEITYIDIYTLDPFGNEMILYNLTGHEIKELLLNAYELDGIYPLLPSGMKSRYHLAQEGGKTIIKDIELLNEDGTPLDMDRLYRVELNGYIAAAYRFPHKAEGKSLYQTTANALIEWLKARGTAPTYEGEVRVERVMEE